jgi:uncharacterized protein
MFTRQKAITSSPYFLGSLIGVIFVLSVWSVGGYFGTTTTFSRIGSYFLEIFHIDIKSISFFMIDNFNYTYHKLLSFQTMFVVGLIIGGFIGAVSQKTFKISLEPPKLFQERFGRQIKLRLFLSFIGGAVMIFGARIANGCSSWYGISSFSKLDLVGVGTLCFFFIGAVIINLIIYRKRD